MVANELRVGNIVNNGIDCYADHITIAMAHNYNPVPLTKEWLLKFGFEYTDGEDAYECIWSHSGVEVWQHDSGFCHSYVFGGDVMYVHCLQNLFFSLTGQELEIVV